MKVTVNKSNSEIVRALRRAGFFGISDREVVNALLARAAQELILTEYVRKMREFVKSIKL